MEKINSIIFIQRARYEDGHWYANIGYYCDDETHKAFARGAQLCRLDLKTGSITVLLEARNGCIRDPQVHYDGKKIVFAWRKEDSPYYHLYEMKIDGSEQRQLTSGPYDDYEPSYLPDGGLVFISTRCRRWVNCWKTQVGTLHRCDADGANIRMLSCNIEHDNTPAVLPDGRILYMRWEYVDRSQVDFHHLWTMNPDGTNQKIFYGNERPKGVFIGARPVPGSDLVLGVDSPGHGRSDHYGFLSFWTDQYGPDDPAGQIKLNFAAGTVQMADPWPFSKECILAVDGRKPRIIVAEKSKSGDLYDIRILYEITGCPTNWIVQEPRPVMARKREQCVPDRTDLTQSVGYHLLVDVYNSQNMPGVERGEIKKLLIIETLPKPVNFSGGMDLTSWMGTFTLQRILGTVPVEDDGSAFFELPADRPVLYIALDKNNLSIKRMQSFTSVAPGETTSCLGCHEDRKEAPQSGVNTRQMLAMGRPASKIEPIPGVPDVPDFIRDVQPVLDAHCISCHNVTDHKGDLSLEGDMGPSYSISYYSLLMRNQIADGRNGYGNRAPRTIGSSASPLLRKIEGGHHDINVSPAEWTTVWAWLEAAAPFCGTYGGLRNAEDQNAQINAFQRKGMAIIGKRCISCHVQNGTAQRIPAVYDRDIRHKQLERDYAPHERTVFTNDPMGTYSWDVILNASRPDKSALLLAPLSKEAGGRESCGKIFTSTNDPDYQQLLAALKNFQQEWSKTPRFGFPNFQVNPQYVREMIRFGVLPAGTDPKTVDPYVTDRAYWDLFDRSKQIP
ncbi:MAG: hypothetical protein MUC65_05075 [Pontiellaceae bacterium]|nr:hypothetical protein [Pontiellaceae bacterium]